VILHNPIEPPSTFRTTAVFGMSRDHNRKRLKLGLSGSFLNYNNKFCQNTALSTTFSMRLRKCTILRKIKIFKCFYSLLKIYNFRNIVHFLKRILQVVDNAVFCFVMFRKRPTQSEFLDIFYCGHVTYQICAWFETFEGKVIRTNMANFDAHWTSGAKKRRF